VQKLQRLHDHLDVADAAAAQLHVEPGLAQAAGVGGLAELRAQRPHLVDHLRVDGRG